MMRSFQFLAFAAPAALLLAACDNKGGANASGNAAGAETSDKTLADSLGGDDSTFASAAKAAGLDATLAGPGPYTVFVPTNAAFEKLPAGTLDGLMKPESKADLTTLLSGHVLAGTVLAQDIAKGIETGKGKTQLMTMAGTVLTATKDGDRIVLTDAAGGKSVITGAETSAKNGVIHRVDSVLMAK